MRISELHNELSRQGRVPVEKIGRNKGIQRAWRASRHDSNGAEKTNASE